MVASRPAYLGLFQRLGFFRNFVTLARLSFKSDLQKGHAAATIRAMRTALKHRITPQDLQDYHNYAVPVEDLAAKYGVGKRYFVREMPRREPLRLHKKKAELRATRLEFRSLNAKRVIAQELTVEAAARICRCSLSTMFRQLRKERA